MGLAVKGLVKRYGAYTAVDTLSFAMDRPGVFALLGTNGAGKTTTIRMLLGMLAKDSGEVTWEGKAIDPSTGSVGYLAEERGLYPKATVQDQLTYFARLKGMGREEVKRALDYWFARMKVEEHRHKKAEALSKGNQQKIQFIAALISDPKLLILDEPLSGLDPVNADQFREVIREQIAKGKFIIMSSHQMATVEEFCDDLVILNKGKTVLEGNLNTIKKSYGRNRLSIKCEEDIVPVAQQHGLRLLGQTASESEYYVPDAVAAKALLTDIVGQGLSLVKFELREPTLHEIFVEKVGDAE